MRDGPWPVSKTREESESRAVSFLSSRSPRVVCSSVRFLTSSHPPLVPPVRRSFTRLLTSSLRFGPSFIPVSLIPVGRAEPGPACGRASPTGMETERNEE